MRELIILQWLSWNNRKASELCGEVFVLASASVWLPSEPYDELDRMLVISRRRQYDNFWRLLLTLDNLRTAVFVYVLYIHSIRLLRHIKARGLLQSILEVYTRTSSKILTLALTYVPSLRAKVKREMTAARLDMQSKIAAQDPTLSRNLVLPAQGKSGDWMAAELARMKEMKAGSDWKNGRVSGAVYHGEATELDSVIKNSMLAFLLSNPCVHSYLLL